MTRRLKAKIAAILVAAGTALMPVGPASANGDGDVFNGNVGVLDGGSTGRFCFSFGAPRPRAAVVTASSVTAGLTLTVLSVDEHNFPAGGHEYCARVRNESDVQVPVRIIARTHVRHTQEWDVPGPLKSLAPGHSRRYCVKFGTGILHGPAAVFAAGATVTSGATITSIDLEDRSGSGWV